MSQRLSLIALLGTVSLTAACGSDPNAAGTGGVAGRVGYAGTGDAPGPVGCKDARSGMEGCGPRVDTSTSGDLEDFGRISSAVTSSDFTDATGTVKVRIMTCDWVGPQGVNEATCTMDAGWVLVGGGGEIEGEGSPGALLKASFPSTNDFGGGFNKTWVARSAESIQTYSHRLRAYAVGLQLVGMSEATLSGFNNLWRAENTSTIDTSVTIDTTSVPFGFTLIGGGAEVVFNTNNIYLTQSQPVFDTNNGFGYLWRAAAKNNQTSNTGAIKAYVVAVKTCPDSWNGSCLRADRPLVTSGSGSGYLTVSATIGSPWVTTSIGGLARQGTSAGRYLTDLIPLTGTSQGFTVRTKSHGGCDTATMDGVGLGLEAAY